MSHRSDLLKVTYFSISTSSPENPRSAFGGSSSLGSLVLLRCVCRRGSLPADSHTTTVAMRLASNMAVHWADPSPSSRRVEPWRGSYDYQGGNYASTHSRSLRRTVQRHRMGVVINSNSRNFSRGPSCPFESAGSSGAGKNPPIPLLRARGS